MKEHTALMKENFKEQEQLYRRGLTLVNQGLTLKEIARKLKISRQRTTDLLAGARSYEHVKDLKKERERLRMERDKRIWELRAEGLPHRAIAKEMRLSLSSVRIVLDSDKSRADKLTQQAIFREQKRRRQEKKRARKLKKEGLTNEQVAKMMHKSSAWVQIVAGEYLRKPICPEERMKIVEKASKLLDEGYLMKEIVYEIGHSKGFIHKVLKEAELKERGACTGSKKEFEKKLRERRVMRKRAKRERLKKKRGKEQGKAVKNENGDINNDVEKIAVGYCRVSTEEQEKEGRSLDDQAERIKAQAKVKGWKLEKIISDSGFSGSILKRPGMEELIILAKAKAIDIVIVYRLDRLSRNLNHTLDLVYNLFEKNNIKFVSLSEDFDTTTPHGKAMLAMVGIFAQLERDTIARRAKETSEILWSEGKWMAPAAPPLGFRVTKDYKLLEEPKDRKRVEKLFRLLRENEGKAQNDSTYLNYEEIGILCGISKSNVYRLGKTVNFKAYKEKYKEFLA